MNVSDLLGHLQTLYIQFFSHIFIYQMLSFKATPSTALHFLSRCALLGIESFFFVC